MPTEFPPVALNDGRALDRIGLGAYLLPEADGERLIGAAFALGYRRVDTAALYGNEELVGRALAGSGLPRADVALTTKVWNADHGYDAALRAFEASRRRLAVDYVDVLLIHWPCPERGAYVDTWRALIALREQGLVRTIGVSNFLPEHLDRLIGETGVAPALNQVELHPHFQQERLRRWHAAHGIATEAWSPLGRGSALADPVLRDIAARTGRSVAQVILRWHLQLGTLVIPKSANVDRLRENFELGGFELDDRDLARIAGRDRNARSGPDPASVG